MSQLSLLAEDVEPKDLDEFYTPSYVFDPLNAEFKFDLDPCATAEAAKCLRYFSKNFDGLSQYWTGKRVWMNPPYSALWEWTAKVHQEMSIGSGAELVVGLYPANRSEQPFWQHFIEPVRDGGRPGAPQRCYTLETRFIGGRIRFGCPGNPTGHGAKQTASFPSVLLIWRRR